ncbi:MAG TPA: hypothetical protein PK156_51405, partial [Polyangium sp.]|nr:hypothetical protein [Polyangium sp.]
MKMPKRPRRIQGLHGRDFAGVIEEAGGSWGMGASFTTCESTSRIRGRATLSQWKLQVAARHQYDAAQPPYPELTRITR